MKTTQNTPITEGMKVRYQSGKRMVWAGVLEGYEDSTDLRVIRRGPWGSIVVDRISLDQVAETK